MYQKNSFHFLGIGGAGMNPLAKIALENNFVVSGSDQNHVHNQHELEAHGAKIWAPHSLECLKKLVYIPEYLVYSTAIPRENAEFQYLVSHQSKILHRSDLLQLFADFCEKQVVIAGTHGKTTTTSLLIWILEQAGIKPSWSVGGTIKTLGASRWSKEKNIFVLEGDESDQSFLKPTPDFALLTSVEPDHLENYNNSFDVQKQKFQEFIDKANFIVLHESCLDILNINKTENIIYSETSHPAIFEKIQLNHIEGEHNRLNALSAILLAEKLGVSVNVSLSVLRDFPGIKRRFEKIFADKQQNITIIDDYAHHPTELKKAIQAGLELAQKNQQSLQVVFQPHLPTRLRDLWLEFVECLSDERIDVLFLTDLYLARGKHLSGVDSANLAKEITHQSLHYIAGELSFVTSYIKKYLSKNTLLLVLGAGDINTIVDDLMKH